MQELTPSLRQEYRDLWRSCVVLPDHAAEVDGLVTRIAAGKRRYVAAGKPHGVPWHVVGVIHMLEGGGDFSTHLHNGDPLTARTVHVPKGRPATGRPPFTWEVSASDALVFDGLDSWKDWSLTGTLFVFERFNGFGYRPLGINSPYLWSFSNHYTKGKFIHDNDFSPTAVSGQCGAAVLLSRLVARGLTTVTGPAPAPGGITIPGDGILRKGSKGPVVTKVKALLKRWFDATSPGEWAGFGISTNDVYGDGVVKAVTVFQSRLGLELDGKVGQETLGALIRKPSPPPPAGVADLAFPEGMKQGASGVKVKLVQGWLTLHGFPVGVDGSFQDGTVKALKGFQARVGLPATGVVDRPTWAALVAPMVAALAPVKGIRRLGPLVVAYAQQHLKQKPLEAGGDNRGPWVRLYTDGQEGQGAPWCAGFATFIVQQACRTLAIPMPVHKTLLADDIATFAGSKFVNGDSAGAVSRLHPGSIFLVRDVPGSSPKYKHCGIIVSTDSTQLHTIEGNTNNDGSSNGIEVLDRTRRFLGLDYVVI